MTIEREQLERLITRVLDGEASAAETARLDTLRHSDPEADALYEKTRLLDALVGAAVREVLEPAPRVIRLPRRGEQLARYLIGGAAAAVAIFAWLYPTNETGVDVTRPEPMQAGLTGPHVLGDVIEPVPSSYETPELRIRGTEREWILIPADQPGLYWIIEADRERTQVVPLSSDL